LKRQLRMHLLLKQLLLPQKKLLPWSKRPLSQLLLSDLCPTIILI
jgi:hypothetical protein